MYTLVLMYDKVADTYSAPMLLENNDCAIRYFKSLCKNKPDMKDDYELYLLGQFDTKTANVVLEERPKLIIKGLEIK